MGLPNFEPTGDLPAGVYDATLAEMLQRFGLGSTRRHHLASRLERIYRIAANTGFLARFVVFGSYVTSKREPNDVDDFMIMDDNFDVGKLVGESPLLFDHLAAQARFGCSVFWVRRLAALGGEQAAIEDWQVTRSGTLRGIIEITGDST